MAFSVPTFNLECEVWSGPWNTKSYRFTSFCNLALGRRVQQPDVSDLDVYAVIGTLQMGLLLPKGTDLHDRNQGFDNDVIEVPVGSGRWYGLAAYDDVGKGFSNEYRIAIISKISRAVNATVYSGLDWPTPCP